MNAHDDERTDAALEALARPQPPEDHVARVLARTGAPAGNPEAVASDVRRAVYLKPRWVLPVAASILAVLGATWQGERQLRSGLDGLIVLDGSASRITGETTWGAPEDIVRPVLPPQAYWGMDAFEEWNSLRPGTGFREPGSEIRPQPTRTQAVMAWVPVPSGLPAIELESLAPAPLVVAPLAPPEDIALAAIPLEPIDIAPLVNEVTP